MKQKHRKWAGVALASAMMLLSATGSGYASENSGHLAHARYMAKQNHPAAFVTSEYSAAPAIVDSSNHTAAFAASEHSAAPAIIDPSNPTDRDFVPLLGQISLSSDFHDMLHQWSEKVRRPLKEMASLLSDSQQAAAETLLRNLNTAKTSEDKNSGIRMVQTR